MFYLKQVETLSRVTLSKPLSTVHRELITPEAIEFLTRLHTLFEDRRRKLLARRSLVQRELDMGIFPNFIESTRGIREGMWRVRPAPAGLADRMVEIMAPAGNTRSMITGYNSGANVLVADFEDTQSPSWSNTMEGHRNLRDTVRGNLTFLTAGGEKYGLNADKPTLMVRLRGWHMSEKHFCLDTEPMSASLFDFGLFMFHNGRELVERGSGPYFYLPKIENRFEAALWNEAFVFAEEYLGIPPSSVRATVLVDSVLAVFEMDEILYELRDRSAGLSCGQWNYLFSMTKNFKGHKRFVLPDRGLLTMDRKFMHAYLTLLIQTCHRRGAHAIGGMPPRILPGDDPAAAERVIYDFRREKFREARAGFDGTRIGDAGLVGTAQDAFGSVMTATNQLGELRTDTTVCADDLLRVTHGDITEAGLRTNIDSGIRYIEAWLSGTGEIPLDHLMVDACGADFSRAQVWQWLRHSVRMKDGNVLTPSVFRKIFAGEVENIRHGVGPERHRRGHFDLASRLYFNLVHHQEFPQFFTTTAYQYL